jgi:hypothetical protein
MLFVLLLLSIWLSFKYHYIYSRQTQYNSFQFLLSIIRILYFYYMCALNRSWSSTDLYSWELQFTVYLFHSKKSYAVCAMDSICRERKKNVQINKSRASKISFLMINMHNKFYFFFHKHTQHIKLVSIQCKQIAWIFLWKKKIVI